MLKAKFHYAVQLATSLRRPARELVAAGLRPRSRRPASEQDSVMEYGLNKSATRFELSRLVEIVRTCLRHAGNQVCDQVCDLDSAMEFSQSRSHRPAREPAREPDRELDSVMELAKFHYAIQLANQLAS